MTGIFSSRVLWGVFSLIILGISASPNAELWAACLVVLPTIVWILGGNRGYPVLVWVVGINWLAVAADVLRADLSELPIRDGGLGPYAEQAILISLSALLAIAVGMRCGVRLGESRLRARLRAVPLEAGIGGHLDLGRLLVCYFISLAVAQVMGLLAALIPTLTQPFLAFSLLKYVVLYAIAATVFESDRGYLWLLLIIGGEFIVGMTGYFANFTQPAFVLVLAMVSSRYAFARVKTWVLGLAGIAVLLWVSIVWTAIKPEYRSIMYEMSLPERGAWLVGRYLSPQIDYTDAATQLLDRIGYTELFAQVLAGLDAGAIGNDSNFYGAAIKHVLTPRVLFPDKAALDDSKITTALTGEQIDEGTSIGVGYITEAQVDFGFPGLLVPMLAIGFMLGLAAEYFMTCRAPPFVRQAFATSTLFSCFAYAADIDKSLGGFITGWLAMGLVVSFIYPRIARWLVVPNSRAILPLRRALT
jgi:hypothetical protein